MPQGFAMPDGDADAGRLTARGRMGVVRDGRAKRRHAHMLPVREARIYCADCAASASGHLLRNVTGTCSFMNMLRRSESNTLNSVMTSHT